MLASPEMKRRDAGDDEGTDDEARTHHMCEAIGERRVEDHLPPVERMVDALGVGDRAGRRLHPAVRGDDPGRAEERARGHHAACKEVHAFAYSSFAEENDADEAGLE